MKILISLLVFGWCFSLALAQDAPKKEESETQDSDHWKDDYYNPPKKKKPGDSSPEDLSDQESEEDRRKGVDKKTITGSRIRSLESEGVAPVKVITKEEFEKGGYGNITSVLESETTYTIVPGSGSRGLGHSRELHLINGKRLPNIIGFYINYYNFDKISLSAIERIEIITGGGSAVYGSDAISSVSNIIIRRDLEGFTASVKPAIYGLEYNKERNKISYHAAQVRSNISYGTSFHRGYFFNDFSYNTFPGKKYYETLPHLTEKAKYGPTLQDQYIGMPGSDPPMPNCKKRNPQRQCVGEYTARHEWEGPKHDIFNMAELHYDVTDDISFSGTLMTSYDEISTNKRPLMRLPYRNVSGREAELLPNSLSEYFEALNYDPNDNPVRSATIQHFMKSHGHSQTLIRNYAGALLTGFQGDIGLSEWRWDFSNTLGFHRRDVHYGKMVLLQEAKDAIAAGKYDPINPENASDATGLFYDAWAEDYSLNASSNFFVDGVLFDKKGLTISTATGSEFIFNKYKEERDPQTLAGNVIGVDHSSNNSASRKQYAFFAELGANYSHWLMSSMAMRYDRYSDFNSSFVPQFGLKITPFKNFYIRGNYEKGFRAPSMADLYTKSHTEIETIFDYEKCAETPDKPCLEQSVYVEHSGNPKLQEELADKYSIGVGLNPTRNLRVMVDYWYHEIRNEIQSVFSTRDLSLSIARGEIDSATIGAEFERGERGEIVKYKVKRFNLGQRRATGVDFAAYYGDFLFPRGGLGFMGIYRFTDESKFLKSSPWHSKFNPNTNSHQPRYMYLLTWSMPLPWWDYKVSFQLKRKTVGSYVHYFTEYLSGESGRVQRQSISSHSKYDLSIIIRDMPYNGFLQLFASNVFKSSREKPSNKDPERSFNYIRKVSRAYLPIYFVKYTVNF